jgi:hypothetical protein
MPFMNGGNDEGLTMDEASFVESWTGQRVGVVLRPRSSGNPG